MSFRKLLERKLLSTVLATTLAISTVLTSAAPALAVEGEPSEQLVTNLDESAAPVEMSDGTATPEVVGEPIAQPAVEPIAQPAVEPVAQENGQEDAAPVLLAQPDAAAPAVERDGTQPEGTTPSESTGTVTPQAPMLRAPAAVTATGTSLTEDYDPSDLSNWVVYDHYYNAAWPKTGPSNWDVNANGGYHPFFYWKEGEIYKNNKFYDLSTAADKARIQTEVFAPSAPRELNTPCVAYFSQHIYTEGSKNNATITFLGYGETFKTDWAIAPVTTTELKSIAFDIDASKVNPHTLDGFGIIVNAGIDRSNDTLKGYVLNFKMANNSQGTTNGVVQLIDISRGTNASKLHDGLNGYQRLADPNVGTATSLGTFDLKNSPIGKIRVDLDIEPTKLGVKLSYYPSTTGAATQAASYNVNLTDTKFAGFGPIVNYNGDGHICARLSSVTFGSTVISVPNYAVIFDGNGATVQANPDRVNNVPKGKSMKDMGYAMPTPPQRTGYVFIGWNTAQDGTGTAFDDTFVVNQITTVYAQWSLDQLAVTYAAGANGSLQGSATETVNYGDHPKAVPTPVPNAGYQFSHWEDGSGKTYANAAAIEAVTIQGPMTFTAIFDRIPNATVTYKAGANGSLQGNATETVQIGGHPAQVPTPVPAAGFSFSHWEDDQGQTYANAAAIQAVTINGDMTFTAVFDQIPAQTVTYKAGANGSLQGNATEQVAWGGHPAQVPTPVPAAGFSFSHWEDDQGQTYANAAAIQAVTVTGPITFTAIFDKIPDYTVNYVAGPNGTLNGASSEKVAPGGTLANTPTPVPAKYYEFVYWEDNDKNQYTAAQLALLQISGDVTFTAVFAKQQPLCITYVAGPNGTLQGNANENVMPGDSPVNVPTPVANKYYEFKYWEDQNGVKYPTKADVEKIVVSEALTLTANFDELSPYKIDYVAGPNGSLTGPTTENVKPGDNIANPPTTVPATNYEFQYWQDQDGNKYLTDADLMKAPITGDMIITAIFDLASYKIIYCAGPNGTIGTPNNEVVKYGGHPASVPTTTPNAGYVFEGWKDQNGTVYPTNADVEKITVSSDLTLTAVFELNQHTVTFVAGAGGSIAGTTTQKVRTGASVTSVPTPTANQGFTFQYWEDDNGNQYKNANQVMRVKIADDITFTAVFDTTKIKVKYVAGNNGTLNGTDLFPSVPVGGKLTQYAPAPTPVPDQYYMFDHWEDVNGAVIDPATAVAGDNTTKIKAKFEKDENGDNIPDKDQQKIKVNLEPKGPGRFAPTDITKYTVVLNKNGEGFLGKTAGFVEPQLIPDKTVDPTVKFFWWEDAQMNKIVNLKTQVLKTNCTLYALFDTDKNGNDIPDSREPKIYTVTFKVKGGGGKLQGTTVFKVEAKPNGNAVLRNAIGGYIEPRPVGNKGMAFYRWEDINGNEVTNTNQFKVSGDAVIYARFGEDTNGDGIADIGQNKYIITFIAGPGGSLQGNPTYTLIGGRKGDNRPLFLMDVVGQFIQPTPVANSGYTFTGWNPQFSATYPITGDTVFVANFKKVKDGGGCRVKFRCNNKDWKDFDCNKGSKVKDGCGNSIPTPSCPSGYKFVGWQGSDGKIYTNVQVLQITVTIDITFTAVFTRVG